MMPFNPGRIGQNKTKSGEVLRRVWLLVKTLVLFPLSLPFLLIGVVLRVLATHTKRNIFYVRVPEANTEGGGDSASGMESLREERVRVRVREWPEKIRIRTQNVGFIPLVSAFNRLMNPNERSELLLQSLIRGAEGEGGKGGDDIICLQEQFHVGVDAKLIETFQCGKGEWEWETTTKEEKRKGKEKEEKRKGKEKEKEKEKGNEKRNSETARQRYGWFIGDLAPSHLRLNSGVTILSRYPLLDPEFTEFTNTTMDNKMASKGVLGCTGIIYRVAFTFLTLFSFFLFFLFPFFLPSFFSFFSFCFFLSFFLSFFLFLFQFYWEGILKVMAMQS